MKLPAYTVRRNTAEGDLHNRWIIWQRTARGEKFISDHATVKEAEAAKAALRKGDQNGQKEFSFTLVLGLDEITDRLEGSVFKRFADSLLHSCDGVVYIDVTRKAADFFAAVRSALTDCAFLQIPVRAVQMTPEEYYANQKKSTKPPRL